MDSRTENSGTNQTPQSKQTLGDDARITAEVRAIRGFGRPTGAVKPITLDRRMLQFQAASSDSSQ